MGKIGMAILGTGILLAAGAAIADYDHGGDDGGRRYTVTVTNLNRGQVITPPVVIVHNTGFRLFTLGGSRNPRIGGACGRRGPGGRLPGTKEGYETGGR